jgi:hypothetical protein
MKNNKLIYRKNKDLEDIRCQVCNKKMDYLSATVSQDLNDAIYLCRDSIKQKIFVYGKYIGGRYGAISINKYFTKDECSRKVCDDTIKSMLDSLNEEEYSRFVTCNRGMMNSIILTKNMVEHRKKDLIEGKLKDIFPMYNDKRKYYCYNHASDLGFLCSCGEELLNIGSSAYRDLTGMEDQKFISNFFPSILQMK